MSEHVERATKKIGELKLNPNNPRFIRDEMFVKLKKSLTDDPEFMDANPIKIDESGVIWGGNMRYRAAKELGWKEVPVVILKGWSEKKLKAFMIKDNASFGDWDWDILGNEWDAMELADWGLPMDKFGIDADNFGEQFTLNAGDKIPFEQLTFTLAAEQSELVKEIIALVKQSPDYMNMDTHGNENSNGNALYLIAKSWHENNYDK